MLLAGRLRVARRPALGTAFATTRRSLDSRPAVEAGGLVPAHPSAIGRSSIVPNRAIGRLAATSSASFRSAQLRRLNPETGSREVGLDAWAWQHLNAWLEVRVVTRVGALLCVIDGPTQGRPWTPTAARVAPSTRERTATIDPPPDGAHAVGAPLRPPSERPPLRAHRVAGTRTSGSPASIYKASTAAKSSTPSTADPHPYSQPAPDSDKPPAPKDRHGHSPAPARGPISASARHDPHASVGVGCAVVSFLHFPPSDPLGAERLRAATVAWAPLLAALHAVGFRPYLELPALHSRSPG
jgi:hypothetical protein